jgi:hypothetical protein
MSFLRKQESSFLKPFWAPLKLTPYLIRGGRDNETLFPMTLLDSFSHPVISPLITTMAASRIGTPLAEFTVRAVMLLVLALFQTADESIGCYLETDSILIDKFLIDVSHL